MGSTNGDRLGWRRARDRRRTRVPGRCQRQSERLRLGYRRAPGINSPRHVHDGGAHDLPREWRSVRRNHRGLRRRRGHHRLSARPRIRRVPLRQRGPHHCLEGRRSAAAAAAPAHRLAFPRSSATSHGSEANRCGRAALQPLLLPMPRHGPRQSAGSAAHRAGNARALQHDRARRRLRGEGHGPFR